jgi:hypothetical protein
MGTSIYGIIIQIKQSGCGFQMASLSENLDPQLVEKMLIKTFATERLRDTAKKGQARPAQAKGRSFYPVLGSGAQLWGRSATLPGIFEKGIRERSLRDNRLFCLL